MGLKAYLGCLIISVVATLVSAQVAFRNLGSSSSSSSSSACLTVSGPDPGKRCVFPFTFESRRYNGCPIDPDDRTKRWCSTFVDANGVHVGGQGKYGHCGPGCPQDSTGTPPSSSGTASSASSGASNSGLPRRSCRGSDECRSIGVCALRFTPQQLDSKKCTLADGSEGLCCSDLTTSSLRNSILPSSSNDDVSSNLPTIPSVDVRQAIDIAESFTQNVTIDVRRSTSRVRPGSASSAHATLQRPRPGVAELNRLALIAMEASRNLDEPDIGVRLADTSNTILDNCYEEPFCNRNSKYRKIDGACNNLRVPLYGRALTPLQRVLPNAYADKRNLPRVSVRGTPLPSARLVSTATTVTRDRESRKFSALVMVFGQFIDHDITHVPFHNDQGSGIDCCGGNNNAVSSFTRVECFHIPIPGGDNRLRSSNCINFVRSQCAPRLDCLPGPSQQVNQITHWLDSSNVYDSEERNARALRAGRGGRMATQRSRFQSAKDLLPDDPSNTECKSRDPCFKAGDLRNSEQPNLAVLHTLFVREHNRIAGELQAVNPRWGDERLYQEAKRLVNAEWQHIVYNEWLPIILGPRYMDTFGLWPLNTDFSRDYRDDFDPRITNEFATAAFRVGHTLIPSLIRTLSSFGSEGRSLLRDMFFNINSLRKAGGVDELLRGLTESPVELADDNFSDEISNFLFDGDNGAMDLVALNIQRGRDHGLPGYIRYRQICRVDNGRPVRTFDDLRSNIGPAKRRRLQRVYDSVEDIDLFVGMFMEDPGSNDAFVGDTFLCLIGDQFARLKKGDRFFYDLGGQAGSFTLAQLDEIRKVTMARLICDNSDSISQIQPLVFALPTLSINTPRPCDSNTIPRMNMAVFTGA